IVKLADANRDRALGLEGHICRALGWMEMGDLARAEHETDFCMRTAADLRQPYYEFIVAALQGSLAFLQGRIGEVDNLAREALPRGEKARAPNAPFFFAGQMATLMWLQGRLEELEPILRSLSGSHPSLAAHHRAALAVVYAEQGRV